MTENKLNKWLDNFSKQSTTGGDAKGNTSNKTFQKTIRKSEPPKKIIEKKKFGPKKPEHKRPGTQTKNGVTSFTNHDPTYGRLTREKREKFHPTNFLKSGNVGNIRIVPLGGMEEVGLNMMFIEWENDIIVIDVGLLFPSPEHLGVDVLVPDISYLKKNKNKIRGVFFTHGHLDHIGAVPYLAKELGFPKMYASRLTKELILAHSSEHLDVQSLKIMEINPKTKIKLGRFECEFFHVNHSIPDCLGICVNTPYGAIVHSSDFKIDHNPSDGMPADLNAIAKIGARGVLLAMVDSTNSLASGHTLSESIIEKELEKIVERTRGRLIVTTFASSVGRVAKLIEAAEKNGRTVFLSGRSMEKNIAIARKLNYLKCKDKTLNRMSQRANTMDPSKVMILSTGSQGEELAALTRMAAGVHRDIKLSKSDNIIFSSSPIPGNEMAIVAVRNNLAEIGCRVIDKEELDIYVSGHGHREELKLFTTLMNPKYFAPIHGEMYMRYAHQKMVIKELGFSERNTFIMKNGKGIVFNKKGARLMDEKEQICTVPIMIESAEKLGEHVLADRTQMSDDGVIFIHINHSAGKVKKINVRSRGFIYMGMQHEVFDLLSKEMKQVFDQNYDSARPEKAMEETLKKSAEKILLRKFKKEPLVEVIM